MSPFGWRGRLVSGSVPFPRTMDYGRPTFVRQVLVHWDGSLTTTLPLKPQDLLEMGCARFAGPAQLVLSLKKLI